MLICSQNLLSCKEPYEQELAALEKILSDYEEENYYNMYVLIMNYLGHVNHYCGHEGLVYRLLNNFAFTIKKKAKGTFEEDKDNFKNFVEGRITSIKYDVENGYL